jgi:hypothetical protein
MALQLISALTNFAHQILFITLIGIWKVANKGGVLRGSIWFAILSEVGLVYLLRIIMNIVGIGWLLDLPITPLMEWIIWVMYPIVFIIMLSMQFIGAITCITILAVALFGLVRFLILLITGTTDRDFHRNAFQYLLDGEFSVGAAPIGTILTSVVAGNRIINHTSIYEDPEVIENIVAGIRQQIE